MLPYRTAAGGQRRRAPLSCRGARVQVSPLPPHSSRTCRRLGALPTRRLSPIVAMAGRNQQALPCIFHIIYYLLYIKSAFFVVFLPLCCKMVLSPCAAPALPGSKKAQRLLPLCLLFFLFYGQGGGMACTPLHCAGAVFNCKAA